MQPLLGEHLGRLLGNIDVGHREEVGQGFEDRHLGAETAPDAAHFETDHAGADDRQAFGDSFQVERADVVADHDVVDRNARQMARLRAGGDHHLRGLDDFLADLDLPAAVLCGTDEGPVTGKERHLVLLEQPLDAAGELGDDAVLAPDHGRNVDFRRADRNALRGETVRRFGKEVRGVQQRLGRNAAYIEAGAAETRLALGVGVGVGFAAGDFEAELRGADRGHVAAGTAADDEHIELLGHFLSLFKPFKPRAADAPGLPALPSW